MSYKIIADSCCEIPEELENANISQIPFYIHLNGEVIIADDTFDQLDFIKKTSETEECPKSACPSPQDFMDEFDSDVDEIYVVTISAALSGAHNSAELAKNIFTQENGGKTKIHVFNSKSACTGETLTAMKIIELKEQGCSFEEVVEKVETAIEEMGTFFVLETLETLRKNGRLSKTRALVASVLNIKPIMFADEQGEIQKISQSRGMEKALKKMMNLVVEQTTNMKEKIVGITHCNALQRALAIKENLEFLGVFKKVFIVNATGLGTMYANNGGIIVTV